MGIIFEKLVDEFRVNPTLKIYNKRINLSNMRVLNKVDLTFKSIQLYEEANYPYIEKLDTIKKLIPVPTFLLNPLLRYTLPYEINKSELVSFEGQKTVIYLHGVGGIAEENSILHRQLLQNSCNLIRISYAINNEKENISSPKKATDILPFINEIETRIAPIVNEELKQVLDSLKIKYPDLFENKEIILIAHSLGGGIIANLASNLETIKISKLINLDGTIMNPAITKGLNISQLHLSQDSLFDIKWLDEPPATEPLKAIGQDYCKRINTLIENSTNKSIWIQIKDSTHFSFTDFPNLLKPYKLFKKLAGSRSSSARIRKYVIEFVLGSDILKIDSQDNLIKKL